MPTSKPKPDDDQGNAPEWAVTPEDMAAAAAAAGDAVTAYTVPHTGEVIPMGPASMKLIEWCALKMSEDDQSTAAAQEAMIAAIMNAESVAEILSEQMTIPVEKVLGIPVQINGVRVAETEYADGFPFYAILDVQYGQDMKHHVISVGAFKIMAQLYAMDQLAEFPKVVVFKKKDKATKAGYYPLTMVEPL